MNRPIENDFLYISPGNEAFNKSTRTMSFFALAWRRRVRAGGKWKYYFIEI